MSSTTETTRPGCFVIMPITTSAAYADRYDDQDHFTHVMDHLFTPALERAGYEVVAPSVLGSELIQAEIIKNLEQAELVLCDLSSLNPNVLFELGVRTALNRPVAIVKDGITSPIPFDINAMNIMTYDGSLTPWTLGAEIGRIADHARRSGANANTGNAMWRYFGLTKRASPSDPGSNPMEARLDLILGELDRLRPAQRPGAGVPSPLVTFSAEFPRDLEARRAAASSLLLIGLSMARTIRGVSQTGLRTILRLGGRIRILILDPENDELIRAASRYRAHGTTPDGLKKRIQGTLDELRDLPEGTSGSLEVRVTSFIPQMSMNAIDADTPAGLLVLQHYEYKPSEEPAPIFCLRPTDEIWFDRFVAEAERLWADGVPWPKPSSQ